MISCRGTPQGSCSLGFRTALLYELADQGDMGKMHQRKDISLPQCLVALHGASKGELLAVDC